MNLVVPPDSDCGATEFNELLWQLALLYQFVVLDPEDANEMPNEWELGFVEDVWTHFESGHNLTETQVETIEELYERLIPEGASLRP